MSSRGQSGQRTKGATAGEQGARYQSPGLRKALSSIERSIARARIEHGYALAADGTTLSVKTGTHNRVDYTPAETAAFRNTGATYTHNHPSGTSFSLLDLAFGAYQGLAEVRAVGSQYRYSVRPPAGRMWTPQMYNEAIKPAYDRANRETYDVNWQNIRTGRMTRDEATAIHNHIVMLRVAQETGLQYSRTTW